MRDEVDDGVKGVEEIEDSGETEPDEDRTCCYELECPCCGQKCAVYDLISLVVLHSKVKAGSLPNRASAKGEYKRTRDQKINVMWGREEQNEDVLKNLRIAAVRI